MTISKQASQASDALLRVEDLKTQFHTPEGVVGAVNGISFHVDGGETLGLVGESGCGKSVTALSIMGLLPSPPASVRATRIEFNGQDLLNLSDREMADIRGNDIAMIFQDPMTSLNPALTIGHQLSETLMRHLPFGRKAARTRSAELLQLVGIPAAEDRLDDHPHQFSGGMRQRVMIAMALSCEPRLLIADEPTTALDVTIQAQILDLLRRLSNEFHMAVILITHDMGVVAGMADRIQVMYAGSIVERGAATEVFHQPRHPYTRGLLRSIPRLDEARPPRLMTIEGMPPNLVAPPVGCSFSPRCPVAADRSYTEPPPLAPAGLSGHEVACWVDVVGDDPSRLPLDRGVVA